MTYFVLLVPTLLWLFLSHNGCVYYCIFLLYNPVWGRGEQFHIQSIGGSRTLTFTPRPCARLTGLVIVCMAHTHTHTHTPSLIHAPRVGLCLLKCLTAVSPLTHIWLLVLPSKTPLCVCVCVCSLSQAV